jgi:exodeoxyribonuclease V alpha subunit
MSAPTIQMRNWPRSSIDALLDSARSVGVLSALDQQFASRLSRLYDETRPGVGWAVAITSRQESAGHVCADLRRLAKAGLTAETGAEVATYSALAANDSVDDWLDELRTSPLVEDVSKQAREDAEPRPLVLDERGRLYLRRSFQSQDQLASLVRARTRGPDLEIDWDLAEAGIARLMSGTSGDDDAPRLALEAALARPLAIVTGGPGTGKTTLVARLIALLVEQAFASGRKAPRVRLLAPTGKAAAAMGSSFSFQRETLDLSEDVRLAMNVSAETVHRALYQQARRDAFGRAPAWSLAEDIVVVDEASMVDLELMARLFDACRSVGRIVLLGDPSQLASVDSGAVLSELCERKDESGDAVKLDRAGEAPDFRARAGSQDAAAGLGDSLVRLRTSHRFAMSGGIDRLAEAIRRGDGDGVIEILDDPTCPEVERFSIDSIAGVRVRLIEFCRPMRQEIEAADAANEKLERLGLYRVLCAHRRGPLGAEALCSILDEAGAAERFATQRSGWWLGRMLLVTRNAPEQNLWNGDVGLIEETTLGLRAIFPDGTGGVRSLPAGRLPAHESAIAMSVHKSQGSEFDVVDLVLGDVGSRVLTRELVYTGVTRARERLRIHASEGVIREAVGRRVSRDSGLGERLWAD